MRMLFICDRQTQTSLNSQMFKFTNMDFANSTQEARELMQQHQYEMIFVRNSEIQKRSDLTMDGLPSMVFFSEEPQGMKFVDKLGTRYIGNIANDILDILSGMLEGVKYFKDRELKRSSYSL